MPIENKNNLNSNTKKYQVGPFVWMACLVREELGSPADSTGQGENGLSSPVIDEDKELDPSQVKRVLNKHRYQLN